MPTQELQPQVLVQVLLALQLARRVKVLALLLVLRVLDRPLVLRLEPELRLAAVRLLAVVLLLVLPPALALPLERVLRPELARDRPRALKALKVPALVSLPPTVLVQVRMRLVRLLRAQVIPATRVMT